MKIFHLFLFQLLDFDWIIPLKSRFCDVKFSISKNFPFQIRQVEKFWQNVLVDLQTIFIMDYS